MKSKETLYSPDAMTYVFEGKYKLTQEQLVEDSILLQIAGSDTTQSSLVFALYHLTANNEIQQELREEIRNAVPSGEQLRFSHIAKLPLLEAVIHETMRLHPAVPSGMPRYTPKDGIWVDEIFIPGEMCVSTPTWTIHHGMLPPSYPIPKAHAITTT
jgi:cytochrome P450